MSGKNQVFLQIRVVDNIPALHAVVSDNYGSPCGVANFLCVENCNYDRCSIILQAC